MDARTNRFLLPLLLSTAGIAATVLIVNRLSDTLYARAPLYNLLPVIGGSTPSDARFLLMIVIPLYVLEFLILTVPFASLMLVANRLVKSTTYTQSVMRLGSRFGGVRMMRRALMPALFALSAGDLLLSLVGNWPFQPDPLLGAVFARTVFDPLMSLLSSLVVLPIALAVFTPTWVLDDSGIVSHLKPKQLENRRPPDTEGVGRWYSSYVSGFALLGFPLTMFYRYFYRTFFIYAVPINALDLGLSVFTTVGLPLLMMCFVLPVIMLNEIVLNSTSKIIQRVAKRLGARDVQLEQIIPAQSEMPPQ